MNNIVINKMESTSMADDQEHRIRHCSICPEICLDLDTYCQHLLEHVNELTAQPMTSDVAICRDPEPSTSNEENSSDSAPIPNQSIDLAEICQKVLLGQVILNWAQQFVTTPEKQQPVADCPMAPGSPIKTLRPEGEERRFICNRCPFRAKSIQHLNSHENCHLNNKILFGCEICGAQFSQKSNLKRHSVGHQAGPMLTCVLCPRRFHRRDQMMEHVLSHWSSYRIIIRCPVIGCKESMASRRDLKIHMRKEHLLGIVHCSHCNKSYPGDKLIRHSLNVYATLFATIVQSDPTRNLINLDCTSPQSVIGINYPQQEIIGNERAASSNGSTSSDSNNNQESLYYGN